MLINFELITLCSKKLRTLVINGNSIFLLLDEVHRWKIKSDFLSQNDDILSGVYQCRSVCPILVILHGFRISLLTICLWLVNVNDAHLPREFCPRVDPACFSPHASPRGWINEAWALIIRVEKTWGRDPKSLHINFDEWEIQFLRRNLYSWAMLSLRFLRFTAPN